ncbi:hypothetical protein [Mycobacterium xenopi]|uniref:hypothetical protein n=1 Tax=Mycobacterium xenopi TaxID=1789 RepID=UPI000A166642|nr:hypothetical protein [Mycobacterium xenopi]ORX13056.1 hypothetical protein AWC32_15620 [Mycobacterium xenopi]SPX94950.1 Uncharacterised protein [Mycobacterium xenopi]
MTTGRTEGESAMTKRFEVGDLVQIKSEYEVHGNPSLFRIREIAEGQARLGQLSSEYDGFIGADTLDQS